MWIRSKLHSFKLILSTNNSENILKNILFLRAENYGGILVILHNI